jgi:hypothetical protein
MAATQSFLASPSYGYDFVVATTQASINTIIRRFLHEVGEPLVTVCFVAGPGGAPQEIGYDDLVSRAHGSDPFAVSPDADPRTDPDLFNLAKAGFMMGFQAQIGIPQVSDPALIKTLNYVTLGSTPNSVTYHLMCSQFNVAQLTQSGQGTMTWLSASQPADSPWVFTADVDLRLAAVPGTAFNTLPKEVQDQLKNLSGSAFSVQQLLFDLDNARLMSVPQISGVDGTALYKALNDYFVGAYFGQMKKSGQPVLGCTVTQPTQSASTLAPTDLTIGVSPYVGTPADPDLSCLTYLCATDGHKLPVAQPFPWNWVDQPEANAGCNGAVSVSRTALVALLLKQMLPMVKANCYLPSVRVTLNALGPVYDLKPIGGQDPQVIDTTCLDDVIYDNPRRPPHFGILRFAYDASGSDQAGPNGSSGGASMDCHYLALVATTGNELWISQSLTINMSVRKYLSTTTGTPVNIQRVDVCALNVDAFGQIASTLTTLIPATNSASKNDVNFGQDLFTGVNELYGNTEALVQRVSGTLVDAIPFGTVQEFVFPGGQTFVYSSVGFSQHGDLVSHVVYADPDQEPPGPVLPPGQVANTDRMLAGQWIPNDGYLISGNKQYAAVLQDDGNLVLVYCTNGGPDLGRPFWSWAASKPGLKVGNFTGTPCFATMQADGNFVLYNGRSPIDPGSPYWATHTVKDAFGPFFAIMQNDRNFVVYSGVPDANTGVLFATNTNI